MTVKQFLKKFLVGRSTISSVEITDTDINYTFALGRYQIKNELYGDYTNAKINGFSVIGNEIELFVRRA